MFWLQTPKGQRPHRCLEPEQDNAVADVTGQRQWGRQRAVPRERPGAPGASGTARLRPRRTQCGAVWGTQAPDPRGAEMSNRSRCGGARKGPKPFCIYSVAGLSVSPGLWVKQPSRDAGLSGIWLQAPASLPPGTVVKEAHEGTWLLKVVGSMQPCRALAPRVWPALSPGLGAQAH